MRTRGMCIEASAPSMANRAHGEARIKNAGSRAYRFASLSSGALLARITRRFPNAQTWLLKD